MLLVHLHVAIFQTSTTLSYYRMGLTLLLGVQHKNGFTVAFVRGGPGNPLRSLEKPQGRACLVSALYCVYASCAWV